MFERYGERARLVVSLAADEAWSRNDETVRTDHLLVGLLREENGLAAVVLRALGVEATDDGAACARAWKTPRQVILDAQARRVLERAETEMIALGAARVGTEHVLLALLREREGPAWQILLDRRVVPAKVRDEIGRMLANPAKGTYTPIPREDSPRTDSTETSRAEDDREEPS